MHKFIGALVLWTAGCTQKPLYTIELYADQAVIDVGDTIEADARSQLRGWWGSQIDAWDHVATYRIRHGQPRQRSPFNPKQQVRLDDGRFVCGDHRDTASIQGAMYSGRRCALAIADEIGQTERHV